MVLKAAKLEYATKAKQSVTSQKHGLLDFWRIANGVLNKGKSAIPLLFNSLEVLSFACHKAKLVAKNSSKNANLDESGIFLPVFPSRTRLKLHNISVTPKKFKRIVTNLDLSRVSNPDCIPLMAIKNYEPKLPYMLIQLSICV